MTREFPPITLRDLVAYAGATGEVNPVHYDLDAARAAGFERILVHGMFTLGLAGVTLAEGYGALAELDARFVAPMWCGETPTVDVTEGEAGRLEFRLCAAEREILRGSARREEA